MSEQHDTTEHANTAIEWLMRSGYGARGAVYFLIGAIAVFAAINGGEAEGSSGALGYLVRQPLGEILLAIVAAGLFAYTLWRLTDAFLDLDDEGDDAEGYLSRAGQFMSGATHAFLGASAVAILFAGSSRQGGGGGNTAESWSATLMNEPFGRFVVGAAGIVTFAVGIYLFIKAWKSAHKDKIRNTPTTEKLEPVIRFGFAAHGGVLLIIGGLIAAAALTADPQKAAGLEEALSILESQAYGRVLLGLAGAGMVGFSIYCFIRAVYGVVPKASDGDVPTLATT